MKIIKHKKAYFNYEILDDWEAGILLSGHETKSIRGGQVNLKGTYVIESGGELFIRGMYVTPWKSLSNLTAIEADRERKLLLHRKTITYLSGKMKQKGLSVVPLELYFKGSLIKIKVGLAKGKKGYQKKQILRERSIDKEAKIMLKRNY